MKKSMGMLVLGVVSASSLLVGCGPVATGRDDGVFEPSREERVQGMATQFCNRFDACGEIGPGQGYESYSECTSELESDFYDLWPADECANGQIDSVAYENCYQRAENYPCDSNVFDLFSFLGSCDAETVCIDPSR